MIIASVHDCASEHSLIINIASMYVGRICCMENRLQHVSSEKQQTMLLVTSDLGTLFLVHVAGVSVRYT